MLMYTLFQAIFTVATMALTVPIFLSYKMHVVFQILKVSASVWNGGSFLLEVMPRQVILKEKKKSETQPLQTQLVQSAEMNQSDSKPLLVDDLNENGSQQNLLSLLEASEEMNISAEAGPQPS